MALHGAPSPKRTILWSPMKEIADLDLGVLTKAEKERRQSVQTVRKYTDKRGKRRFVGTSALSESQILGLNLLQQNKLIAIIDHPKLLPLTCQMFSIHDLDQAPLIFFQSAMGHAVIILDHMDHRAKGISSRVWPQLAAGL